MNLGKIAREARAKIDNAYKEKYNSEGFLSAVTEACEEEALKGRNSLMVGAIETETVYLPEDAYIYMTRDTRRYLKSEWGIRLVREDDDYIFRW